MVILEISKYKGEYLLSVNYKRKTDNLLKK